MVKVGDFTVQLVRADTKEAFKEHTSPSGDVYAEVEPDIDYFISLGSSIGSVKAVIKVDGVSLGYDKNFHKPRSMQYQGRFERRSGIETQTSLRFNKTRSSGVQDEAQPMLTGKVEVSFYRFGEKYYRERRADFQSQSLIANSTVGGKKCVMSVDGTSSLKRDKGNGCKKEEGKNISKKQVRFKRGERICRITLHYCTALGLIYHKILGVPPDLQGNMSAGSKKDSQKKKRSKAESEAALASSPHEKRVKHEPLEIVQSNQKSCDLVDLTADDDED